MSGSKRRKHVCPVDRAGSLDSRFRRFFQNPAKILKPYIKKGMTVMDIGCGPGFFTIDMAYMVSKEGQVIAVDLQDGMLEKLRNKISGTELQNRITLNKCLEDKIGFSDKIDFALLFYVAHEIPDIERCFKEVASMLKTNGKILIVEPPIHVSKSAFQETVNKARKVGFEVVDKPRIFLSKAVTMVKKI